LSAVAVDKAEAQTTHPVAQVEAGAPAVEMLVAPETRVASLVQALAAAVGAVRNTVVAPVVGVGKIHMASAEVQAVPDRLVKAVTEALVTKEPATLQAPAVVAAVAAIMVEAEVALATPIFMAAQWVVVEAADRPTSSAGPGTCICGKGGQIQPTTDWSSLVGSGNE
jgi:hypothetical protein